MSAGNQLEKWRQMTLSETFRKQADFSRSESAKVHKDVLERFYPDYPLLPIEFLKLYPDQIEAGFKEPPVHSFLSSGTTQRDRSRSAFSKRGLDLYHEFSMQSFKAMLAPFFGKDSHPAGLSMIPSVDEWPTSSLAQMVGWIGDEFPLTYWNETTAAVEGKPVWLFATGFHIVAFADAGGLFPLPKGSIVIETGGTKGKTRSVSREESYDLIERCFGVDRNHIVSEYGMCELASQAYDFVLEPNGPIIPLSDRWFRFPSWAQTKVLGADQIIRDSGDGTLIIDDRIREDIAVPFRTEDRVLLRDDGMFQLKGRVAFSPLKGCSLLAEDLLASPAGHKHLSDSMIRAATHRELPPLRIDRAMELHRLTGIMLEDPRFQSLVHESLGLVRLTTWCLADIKNSVPSSASAWIKAAENSKNTAESWLFIAPRTHDFAVMHPLFIAALLNIRVVVRATNDRRLLHYWQDLFKSFWSFEIIDTDWRLMPGESLPCHSLLAFGSDETIASLRAATPQPVQGFGTWITVSIIHKTSWLLNDWVKDAFSLRQQGCMSTRLLIVWDDDAPETLEARSVTLGTLPHGDHLHLAHSELDFALEGWSLLKRDSLDDLVIGHRRYEPGEGLEALLSSRPLTLPVLRASKADLIAIKQALHANRDFKLTSVDSLSLSALESHELQGICELGTANVAKWTGEHGGQALFFPLD